MRDSIPYKNRWTMLLSKGFDSWLIRTQESYPDIPYQSSITLTL